MLFESLPSYKKANKKAYFSYYCTGRFKRLSKYFKNVMIMDIKNTDIEDLYERVHIHDFLLLKSFFSVNEKEFRYYRIFRS